MVSIKTKEELALMRESGRILADIIQKLVEAVRPGMMTKELDKLANELVLIHKVQPAFLGYNNFPASVCLSVNDEIVHSVPSDRVLLEGDILSIDMGVIYQGWYSDSAITMPVLEAGYGKRDLGFGSKAYKEWELHYPDRAKLIAVTEEALYAGIKAAKVGNHINDIGKAIEKVVKPYGYGIVRELVGHGIGRELHEEPHVPNFSSTDMGPKLQDGMVIAIEPMITTKGWQVELARDKFTYKTRDGSLSAHFEHTVAITKDGPYVLTDNN